MTIPQTALPHLTLAIKLLGWSLAFYLTSGLLVGLAIIPTAVRVYQLYTQDINPVSELVVEAARVVLVVAIIAVGRNVPIRQLLSRDVWKRMANEAGNALEAGWLAIAVQLGVLLLVVLAFNAGVDRLVATSIDQSVLESIGMAPGKVTEARDAVVFLIKNFLVIPVWVIGMLRAVEVIGER